MDYDRGRMRASDKERQETIDRLRGALDEGRLRMDEYLERMGTAAEAVTYGELVPLYADLPPAESPALRNAAAHVPTPSVRPPVRRGIFGRLPLPLKILWTIWATAVAVNVVVYVLVSVTTGHALYPWPLWVAGPAGAALLAVSAGIQGMRGHHGPRELPPS
jgi:hypothetical protein